ncbi:protein kinase [Micromonospora sp. NPDC049102]|uniref:protein kinase domain-containing protein n=1 Tax=Micromonospora sp. NPDC049102 TaxID=3364265 RepID=UPI0037104E0A
MPDASRQLIADRYRLVRPLGQGGMGRVWLARDEMLHRDVAIKELVASPGLPDGERREMRERSMREARAVARLGHVNVVRVFDVLHSGDDPWIVMELVPSRSLQEVLTAEGPMSASRAARIGLGVLAALRAAHRAGVLHRDVKPANVLLAHDGRVVLTDFGLATLPGDPRMTQTGMVLGSPAFLAPERATDGTVGPAADLWSLGATLYAAVEGRTPYQRSSSIATLAALVTEPPPQAQRAGQLTPLLEGLLRREPNQRISGEEAERLLRQAVSLSEQDAPEGSNVDDPVAAGDGDGDGSIAGADDIRRALRPEIVPGLVTAEVSPPAPEGATDVPVSTKGRMRRARLSGALAAGLLLVVLVTATVLNGGLRGDVSDKSAAAPTANPSTSGLSEIRALPPAGWHYYRDDPRFSLPLPDGWQAQRDGGRVEFREPDGRRLLVVDELRPIPGDLPADLRTREAAERERYADYRQVRLTALRLQVRAAEWEWTYTDEDGTPMRAVSRAFVAQNGHGYSIRWTTPAAEWSASTDLYALITDGFGGLPVVGAPRSGPAVGPFSTASGKSAPESGPGATVPRDPAQQSAAPSQGATDPGKQILGFASSRCIEIPGGNATAGVRLQIGDCSRTAKQLWTFPGDGTVRSMGKCLDVAGGSTAEGAAVQLADCSGASSQRFNLNKAHDLVNIQAAKCVDVLDANMDNGARLQIWQCNGRANQKWRTS